MVSAITRFFSALYAPLSRELARMPASAFRATMNGL
jgi:hypothetical protein